MNLLLAMVLAGTPMAEPAPLTDVPTKGASAAAFAPKGWTVEAALEGELNQDAKKDLVVVLLQDGKVDQPRALLWLHGVDGGYQLVALNTALLACFSCLGMKGGVAAPEIRIAKRVVSVAQFGGSREYYGTNHRFRLEGKEPKLIGLDRSSGDGLTGASSSVSTNFLTGVTITETVPPAADAEGKPLDGRPTKKTTRQKPTALQSFRDVVGYGAR